MAIEARLTEVLGSREWLERIRQDLAMLHHEVRGEAELAKAVTWVDRVDPLAVEPVGASRRLLAELVYRRLKQLGVEATAVRLEDLLAQLAARIADVGLQTERVRRGWRELERRERRNVLFIFVGLPCSAVAAWALVVELGAPMWTAYLPMVALLLVAVAAGQYLPWRCPSCGERLTRELGVACGRCGSMPPPK